MRDVEVYLGGEGRNELGSRAGAPTYQSDDEPGVIQALLVRIQRHGWKVSGATDWKSIRKYRGRGPSLAEERNILGLLEAADAADASVVAFVRDADGDGGRSRQIEQALKKGQERFPHLKVIGGAAMPVLDGWILALAGTQGTEELSKAGAQSRLKDSGVDSKDTAAMVGVVEKATLELVPQDAESLKQWLKRADEVLPPLVEAAAKESRESSEACCLDVTKLKAITNRNRGA